MIDSGFTEKAVLLCVLGSWRQDTTQLAREPVWRWDDLYCINSCSGRLVLLSLLVLWPASGPGTVELASADPHLVRYLSFFWSRRFRFSSFLFLFLNLFSIFSQSFPVFLFLFIILILHSFPLLSFVLPLIEVLSLSVHASSQCVLHRASVVRNRRLQTNS